jgi:broad specificity phosphatase PhoE
METLASLAKKHTLEIEETPVLMEQQPEESWKQFERRVRYFCATWKKSGLPLTIVSTHGDWIPAAVFSLIGVGIELQKSGVVVISGAKRDVHLETLINNFSFLKK